MLKVDPSPLNLTYRPIDELRLNSKNPRRHSRKQLRKLADSIKAFGFLSPIIVDEELNVIAGYGRVLACRRAGIKQVPTICVSHLTAAEVKAFTIADNRIGELSCWDKGALSQCLVDLSLPELKFDLELTGFSGLEINHYVEARNVKPAEGSDWDGNLPPKGPSVAEPGDLWFLGPHAIYCGDAREESSYRELLGDLVPSMVFTDPPYDLPDEYISHFAGTQPVGHPMAQGDLIDAATTHFLKTICSRMQAHSTEGSLHYIFMDWRHARNLLQASEEVYSTQVNLCIWEKDRPGMGSFYRSQHELVFVFKNGNAPHRNNVQLGRYGRNRTNIWNYPVPSSFGSPDEDAEMQDLHRFVKPVALVADAILDCTEPLDVVLDPFLGSGTTLIAAERTGRRCYAIESNPRYVDLAIRRYQKLTGEKAARIDGVLFDDLETGGGTYVGR